MKCKITPLILITILNLLIASQSAWAENELPTHTTAKNVQNSSPYNPINRTSEFSVNDVAAYSWANFSHVSPPSHAVTWKWFTPAGSLYRSSGSTIGNQRDKSYESPQRNTVWDMIPIRDYQPAHLVGQWTVKIELDGKEIVTQRFTIADEEHPLIQPSHSFSWPSTVINVKIDPAGPSYARADVRSAIRIWNESQEWFSNKYLKSTDAKYSLVETTSNPANLILIQFNATQTRDNWGYAHYIWMTDDSGNLTIVGCNVSLVLNLRDGTRLNDITLTQLTIHELGHCLGLDHTLLADDVMHPKAVTFYELHYPSTLNLYAVSQLPHGVNKHNATDLPTLPSTILYRRAPLLDRSVFDLSVVNERFVVTITSNLNNSNLIFDQAAKKIVFTAKEKQDADTYSEVTIPRTLLDGPFIVTKNGSILPFEAQPEETSTKLILSFASSGSSNIEIIGTNVIPEFSGLEPFVLLSSIPVAILLIYTIRSPSARKLARIARTANRN